MSGDAQLKRDQFYTQSGEEHHSDTSMLAHRSFFVLYQARKSFPIDFVRNSLSPGHPLQKFKAGMDVRAHTNIVVLLAGSRRFGPV